MALNNSGPISLGGSTTGQSIALEIGQSATGQISLNDANVRTLAGVASGAITMPTNFYGKGSGFGGTTISYGNGPPGAGGYGTNNGQSANPSYIVYDSVTLIAGGGQGGYWNSTQVAQGGSGSGTGAAYSTGGTGGGVAGDTGGGGGGGIGGSDNGYWNFTFGQTGASALNFAGLAVALSQIGYSLGTGGSGGSSSSVYIDNMNGSSGSPIGAGGGGAGWYGGNGGPGALGGGGGGGAAGYTATVTGGSGGAGILIVRTFDGSSYSTTLIYSSSLYTLPNGTRSFEVWLIAAGGGGAGSGAYDGNSGGGGGAGAIVYRQWI